MSICDSEENRKKLAWLVPGYILLAWFFCVLFQPLGLSTPPSKPKYHFNDRHYDIVYLDSSSETSELCSVNGSVFTLEPGEGSALLIRLAQKQYHYRPFNCSIMVKAGEGLDGISAVIEEMDLREHEDDFRQPGGHWGSSVCIDYIEAFTEKTKVKNHLCGEWVVYKDERLNSHGTRQKLIGYCYDDHTGHSCESKNFFLNVVIDSNLDLSRRYSLTSGRAHRGFSIVVSGYRHPQKVEKEVEGTEEKEQQCGEREFQCNNLDGSVHNNKPHCIWDGLYCDTHQNCGFSFNEDEKCPSSSPTPRDFSVSTMTLLIVIWLCIVSVLVLVTMILLRWHRSLRTPLDVITESRSMGGGVSRRTVGSELTSANMVTTGVTSEMDTPTATRAGTVSIMVMYRPPPTLRVPKADAPPTYDSLFMGDSPPNYNMVTVNLPPETATTAVQDEPPKDECACDCDHSKPNEGGASDESSNGGPAV